MSEYECFHPECEWSSDSETGRNTHFSMSHEDSDEIALWMLSCADEKPTYENCKEVVGLSSGYYENNFTSWNVALEEAGCQLNKQHGVSDAELINYMKDFSDVGATVTKEEMDNLGKYSSNVYEKRFGSWNRALRECGLPVSHRTQVTDNELIEYLKGFADGGDYVGYHEMRKNGEMSASMYFRRFGSWDKALQKAGLKTYSEKSGSWNYTGVYRENREKVVKRDGACVVCGDCDIDVHHITPLKCFPDNGLEEEAHDVDNMVCLCREHHNQLEGRWSDFNASEFKRQAKDLYE